MIQAIFNGTTTHAHHSTRLTTILLIFFKLCARNRDLPKYSNLFSVWELKYMMDNRVEMPNCDQT